MLVVVVLPPQCARIASICKWAAVPFPRGDRAVRDHSVLFFDAGSLVASLDVPALDAPLEATGLHSNVLGAARFSDDPRSYLHEIF